MRDPVGAGDAREPHVDNSRVRDVERQPERDREQADDEQGKPRSGGAKTRRFARAEADPQHSPEEVEERRVGERRAHPDLAGVEEDLTDAEAQQHQQVEVRDPQWLSPVEQAEEEDERERDPHPRCVQGMAELALVPTRHRPCDLYPGPGLEDLACAAVDDDLHDLGVVVEEADLPVPVVADLLARFEPAELGRELGHLRLLSSDLIRLAPGDRELGGRLGIGVGRRRLLRRSRRRQREAQTDCNDEEKRPHGAITSSDRDHRETTLVASAAD